MKTHAVPKIGLVSGIGPLAGADILSKIFKNAALTYGAKDDSDYPDLLLINHGIKGVDNTGALSNHFEQELVAMVRDLEVQGATIIGIACNTAHVYVDKFKLKPTTKFVNLIDIVTTAAQQQNANPLLLTSAAAKGQRLYQKSLDRHHVPYVETATAQQQLVDQAIEYVMHYKLNEAGLIFDQLVGTMNATTNVIAGCTELPIAIAHSKAKINVIDSNNELAKALLRVYYNTLKSEPHRKPSTPSFR